MNRKKYLTTAALSLFSALVILLGVLFLRQMAYTQINEERKQQLEELTVQISDTFTNALAFNRACVGTAANLFVEKEYATADDLATAAEDIEELVLTGGDEYTFFFLDENGVCYDKSGPQGVWGDFDQVIGMGDDYTFIADSVNYDGVRWAFVRKLAEPVTTQDGNVTVQYVVLLKSVEYMSRYYTSEAYDDVCETYILKENGTRMYDSVTAEDTISSYNIYKNLRESNSRYGESFADVLEKLTANGVACGNYESGGTEYCYSLAWQSEYQFVLLFLIPADAVALNTVAMVSSMMRLFSIFGVILLVLVLLSVFTFQRLVNSRRIADLKEKSLQEQEQINRKLEESNRTLEQAQKATESALDIARSANRAKSNFLSNMSHDIRTPLNAILGFQKLLLNDVHDPEKVQEYAEKIGVSGQHLLSLINDILDMSRIESGKTTMHSKPFPMQELLDDIETMVTPQVEARHQHFQIEADGVRDLTLTGDFLRLKQILMNLLSNAVKYTPQRGSISLRVCETAFEHTQSRVTLRFAVQDNGIGMSEEFQQRIYEPFVREQNSTTSGIQGTGLGLAITKNLVDLMGGIITVESKVGVGSTFTVELSFRAEENVVAAPTVAEEPSAFSDALHGKHFLIAEDNELNAEIISALLEMEDATCEIAKNGQEALDLFCKAAPGTYDAILMDIQMPVMDGYEAARRIRACPHPEAATIPIAAMTANAFADDVQNALDAGMNAHITKPVDMERLREFMAGITH